ncbi:MAG: MFS transporter [Thermoplasmataceae archaeon]
MEERVIGNIGLNWSTWKQILAAWGGWLLDGYTTIAFLLVVYVLKNLMFPGNLGYWALVLTLAPAAFGAVARVIGSTLLGNYIGDRLGRKTLLTFSILGFSLLTASIGLLPVYSQVGIAAPVLLYVILFGAGLFAGAEYGGGASLAMESVPRKKRDIVGAFVQSGFGAGYFFIVFVNLIILGALGLQNFTIYGWRILLLTSLVPGLLTFVVRLASRESPVFNEMKEKKEISKAPAVAMVKESYRRMIPIFLIMTGILFINTATFSFYPIFLGSFLDYNSASGLDALLIINFISLLGVWTGGIIASNNPSRRLPMLIFAVAFTIPSALFVYLGYTTDFYMFTLVFSIQAFMEAMIFSLLPAFLSETFSKRYRSTAVGVVYNSGAIIGGLAWVLFLIPLGILGMQYLRPLWSLELYIAGIVMILGLYLAKESRTSDGDAIED